MYVSVSQSVSLSIPLRYKPCATTTTTTTATEWSFSYILKVRGHAGRPHAVRFNPLPLNVIILESENLWDSASNQKVIVPSIQNSDFVNISSRRSLWSKKKPVMLKLRSIARLKRDGTRAETRFSSFAETDESI